ncbi:hypothetical protein RHP75_20995 [Pseudomonas sp. SG20056]|uniref:hypothetical protein n=1 Tax=Pseudomonas sp. SG20056 TaxID=3074146 RepID=UPI00287FE4C7|nr:hypothetical protein [Pseudomonas sp. SG20056]WNF46824.1 hypothetical protein RHP75_20995 [Pseudomonas sp. SG20056]
MSESKQPHQAMSQRLRHRLVCWWRRPVTRKERIGAAGIGLFGGFWLGLLAGLVLGPLPTPLVDLFIWAGLGACVGAVLGAIWPKVIGIVLLPFAVFGIGQ